MYNISKTCHTLSTLNTQSSNRSPGRYIDAIRNHITNQIPGDKRLATESDRLEFENTFFVECDGDGVFVLLLLF